MQSRNIISLVYLITIIALFFYSFTQIDLSLTFSRIDFLRDIVSSFQYIGYFNRPLSTFFYILFLVLLFNLYLGFLIMAYTRQFSKKLVWKLIIVTTVILTFSYNAFSYDLFNYIFDAKIITRYHENPYMHKALDYAGDPMLSFMRWTHRVYPYGPVWLGLTVPLSYAGLGLFLPTFFLFKALAAVAFIGTLKFIGKIFKLIAPEREVFGLLFFGLNPLIIIESLVSGHLDIVMMFFAAWAMYLLLQKKYLWAFLVLGISIGIKFVTAFLLPIFIVVWFYHWKKKKINWKMIGLWAIGLMTLTVVIASVRTTFQPWYLVPPLLLCTFLAHRYYIFIPSFIISFFAMLTYVPFLFSGNWDPPIPQVLNSLYVCSYILAFAVTIMFAMYRKTQPAPKKD